MLRMHGTLPPLLCKYSWHTNNFIFCLIACGQTQSTGCRSVSNEFQVLKQIHSTCSLRQIKLHTDYYHCKVIHLQMHHWCHQWRIIRMCRWRTSTKSYTTKLPSFFIIGRVKWDRPWHCDLKQAFVPTLMADVYQALVEWWLEGENHIQSH